MQALSININENLNDITAAEFARSHIVFRQGFDIAQGPFDAHFLLAGSRRLPDLALERCSPSPEMDTALPRYSCPIRALPV
jgi:hypothetical protein